MNTSSAAASILLILAMAPSAPESAQASTALTQQETAEGWRLLFDGKSTKGWHTFNHQGVDSRWSVQNGELVLAPHLSRKISGADLETEERFGDFELSLEWKMSPGGNSGIMYRVNGEGRDNPWDSGPEYQLLDNTAVSDPPRHQAGSVWDLYAPLRDVTKPIGQFNHTLIRVKNNHVEHWLNGVKLLSYTLGSKEFEAIRAKSAYAQWPTFGDIKSGTIVLQDEGRAMSFRNIRIRSLN